MAWEEKWAAAGRLEQEWERRLAHERAVRDSHVAAGNIPAPTSPDPEGGMRTYDVWRFNGKKFFAALEAAGHTKAVYTDCKCSK